MNNTIVKFVKKYRDAKSGWIDTRPKVQLLRDIFIWIQFHLNRGKGFFNFWIDFGKNIIWGAVGIKLLPDYIPELAFISEHPMRYIMMGSIIMLLFFIITSQSMDFLRYTQAESDQGNIRNNYMNTIKNDIKELLKKSEQND